MRTLTPPKVIGTLTATVTKGVVAPIGAGRPFTPEEKMMHANLLKSRSDVKRKLYIIGD
jgi:hypothetical protein